MRLFPKLAGRASPVGHDSRIAISASRVGEGAEEEEAVGGR